MAHLERVDAGWPAYAHTTSRGERLTIRKGWYIGLQLRRGEHWFIQSNDRIVGNPDGYRLLRDVRRHLDDAERDVAAGYDDWWDLRNAPSAP